jgi:hypothetical protein
VRKGALDDHSWPTELVAGSPGFWGAPVAGVDAAARRSSTRLARVKLSEQVPPRWSRSANAIERLHERFKRRIKTQTVLPSADTAAMLFWALLASGQINMRKVDGWKTLATTPIAQPIDLAA